MLNLFNDNGIIHDASDLHHTNVPQGRPQGQEKHLLHAILLNREPLQRDFVTHLGNRVRIVPVGITI